MDFCCAKIRIVGPLIKLQVFLCSFISSLEELLWLSHSNASSDNDGHTTSFKTV